MVLLIMKDIILLELKFYKYVFKGQLFLRFGIIMHIVFLDHYAKEVE